MTIHTPWSANLGAPQAQMELAREFRALGHEVEKFSLEDAFPERAHSRPAGRLARLLASASHNQSFARRALRFVRSNAQRFDVIDANQTDLPYSKASLGFHGLLVGRSVGLIPLYREWEREAARRWPERISAGELAHRLLTLGARHRALRDSRRSLAKADLVNVANRDEARYVTEVLGLGSKVMWLPLGISAQRLAAFSAARHTPQRRLKSKTVAFIGTWNSRKGAFDWPCIVDATRKLVPGARFLFLGTSLSEASVKNRFPEHLREALLVIPSYEIAQLPTLLAGATVGAFPGYLEGFGLGVLEMLAAGLPTVAYDAPGPRDILATLRRPELVDPGDRETFATRLAALLMVDETRYASLSHESLVAASQFGWSDIAKRTESLYHNRLELTRRREFKP